MNSAEDLISDNEIQSQEEFLQSLDRLLVNFIRNNSHSYVNRTAAHRKASPHNQLTNDVKEMSIKSNIHNYPARLSTTDSFLQEFNAALSIDQKSFVNANAFKPNSNSPVGPFLGSNGFLTESPKPMMRDTVYKCQFKMLYRYYNTPPGSFHYGVGDFVIVQSDSGEDLGVVVELMTREGYLTMRQMEAEAWAEMAAEPPPLRLILRMASQTDRERLPDKRRSEGIVLQHCHRLIHQNSQPLPMQIVGVEYQFDRSKIFIHYSSAQRVDYREFVRALLAICRSTIKMLKVTDMSLSFAPRKFAEIMLATGVKL